MQPSLDRLNRDAGPCVGIGWRNPAKDVPEVLTDPLGVRAELVQEAVQSKLTVIMKRGVIFGKPIGVISFIKAVDRMPISWQP
jgi:hypothetical protein